LRKFIDLTGQQFGRLVAIENVEKPEHLKSKGIYWRCKCSCGNEKIVSADNLKSGHTQSCGCISQEKLDDLTGKKFGRLTVLKRAKNDDSGNTRWKCRCDCGNEKIIQGGCLKNGTQVSCGCFNREQTSESFENLIGQKFNKLTVLEKLDKRAKFGGVYWKCACDCGNITNVETRSLRSGSVKSCGCLQKKFASENIKKMREAKVKNRYNYTNEEMLYRKLYSNYKSIAKSRKLEFELGLDYFIKLVNDNCIYCGEKCSHIYSGKALSTKNRKDSFILYNGIDRVDNSLGYIDGNVVTCCETCNRAKLKMSEQDFLSWIERVYNHSIKGDKDE
jgi:hypothetical protein